jgi:hypothetical protein
MVIKLPIYVMGGIVVSREPSPHPPNTPVIIDGRLVKISHSPILKSLKLTRFDLFQTAIARGPAMTRVKILTNILCFSFLIVKLKITGRKETAKMLANNKVSDLPSRARIKVAIKINIFELTNVELSFC